MSTENDNPRSYQDIRRDEIADEYFAPSYDSMPLHYQPAVDYIVQLEIRLRLATGVDVRAEWINNLTGGQSGAYGSDQ